MVKLKGLLEKSYIFLILAIMYAPLILILIFSFFDTSRFSFDNGFSFNSYLAIFTSSNSPKLWSAISNTMIIASVSAVVATAMGTFASIGIFSLGKRSKRVVENINQFPVINSEVVMAVSFLVFFSTFAFPQGYLRLIIAHIAFTTPFVVLSILPKLESMDPNLYEAALDLGANPLKAMMKIIIPTITPGIISGFLLAFTLSMDDFIITELNKGPTTGINTLSTYIYSDAKVQGLETFWFAIFSIILVIMLSFVLVMNLLKIRKQKNKKMENFL